MFREDQPGQPSEHLNGEREQMLSVHSLVQLTNDNEPAVDFPMVSQQLLAANDDGVEPEEW